MTRLMVSIPLALLVMSCVGPMHFINNLSVGMTKSEAIEAIGYPPSRSLADQKAEVLLWDDREDGQSCVVIAVFQGGRLVEYRPYYPPGNPTYNVNVNQNIRHW
jgi:hypothetical protein